ncbi:MAG: hypothetical protein M3Y56_03460 [Armatimonadota bacterium]|nr:hypothetical protein [Armatimonadota bacterium]
MKYFLYIDILGFSDLVTSDPGRVHDLYQVVASLNVHRHYAFKAIVFSDTILIYNTTDPENSYDQNYLVMYLCEFAQDLQHRLAGRDISFRALLTYGDFTHYTLNGIPCFFGQALIDAHRLEKTIKSVGLFIDHSCNVYNSIFDTSPFNENLNFVFLTQSLKQLEEMYADAFPIDGWILEETDICWHLVPEVMMVQRIYENMKTHSCDKVRAKYASAWEFYRKRYPKTLSILEESKFDLNRISPSLDWKPICDSFPKDYSYILKNNSFRQD